MESADERDERHQRLRERSRRELADALEQERRERADRDARVAARLAEGLCAECARGYHINHQTEWRPSVLDAEPINGAGPCLECPCEWRN